MMKKVSGTSHSALVPLKEFQTLEFKTDNELIYEAVVKRKTLMFADDCYYSIKQLK